MRRRFPKTTVSTIDSDPGASELNQLNRSKLLVAAVRDIYRDPEPYEGETGEVSRAKL